MVVLAVLSHNLGQWVVLTYFLDGNRQQVNNVIRKLRRKGFTIESRVQGGYRLIDRIPQLEERES